MEKNTIKFCILFIFKGIKKYFTHFTQFLRVLFILTGWFQYILEKYGLTE